MIKTKEGRTKLKGAANMLAADLSCIVKAMRGALSQHMSAEKADELIDHAVKRGMWDDDEVLFGTLEEISKVLGAALEQLIAKGVSCEEDECDCCECAVDCAEAGCGEQRAEVVAPYKEEQE